MGDRRHPVGGSRHAAVRFGRRDRPAPQRRGVGRRQPQRLQLVIQPGQGQRTSLHVQTGDELAQFRRDRGQAVICQQGIQMVPQHEQLFGGGAAQTVQHHGHATAMPRRALGQQRLQQQPGQIGGGGQRLAGDPRLSVDAKAQGDLILLDGKQRRLLTRQGAAVKGQPERHGRPVGPLGHGHHRVQIQPGFGRGPGDLEDQQIARHTPPPSRIIRRGAGHVIGHRQQPGIDPLAAQPFGGGAEIQHVPRVIPEPQDHPAAAIGRPRHPRHRAGRGRGEDIPRHRRIRHPGTDIAQKGRVMPRAAADHQRDLAHSACACTDRAMGDGQHPVGMGRAEPRKGAGCEIFGAIKDGCHRGPLSTSGSAGGNPGSARRRTGRRRHNVRPETGWQSPDPAPVRSPRAS
ncbi:hypothetical protein PANO111632_21775 [Paracoccus nototheniae]